MNVRLSSLVALVDGKLIDGTAVGHRDSLCTGAFPLGDESSGQVTMLDDPRRVSQLADSDAVAVVTATELPSAPMAQLVVKNHHAAFSKIVSFFRPPLTRELPLSGADRSATVAESAHVHPSAIVGANVTIGQRTRIMPGVVIMPGCVIGEDCVLFPGVTLYEYTQIGDRCVIHSGTILGANGFGYRQENGRHIPTAQLGFVQLDNDVELGACVTIDRATYGRTRIGEGTKIDNQVMIGHNCRIGRHNLLCSQVGIAGSCTTGDHVILAGQVGLKDHIHLGDRTIVGAQAGVMEDCVGDQVYLGSPATPQREQMQIMAVERRLPEMRRELKTLRRDMERIVDTFEPVPPAEPIDRRSKRAA
ncbi:UDP-3-O-(3-hydroxymyristoyl)glucosamine N-acyltransferase [Novipirellula artificiosorum]|uniref:UDP-3-O-acylglucosamine N-acyltransferase n=1 Tax=Novipirellula artificiosorum TaxID=2528016 RepID=A0A5C6DFF8_9BACT|nr:UDP-3-O-(3-hydroxymyristoyl)glucosamine N-acyltransferase [Novipirellula artificiosorum]TWU34471.1 UDP-3-O-acylglucosamine N-acyltransferase [Novipirellula artificiosorum]